MNNDPEYIACFIKHGIHANDMNSRLAFLSQYPFIEDMPVNVITEAKSPECFSIFCHYYLEGFKGIAADAKQLKNAYIYFSELGIPFSDQNDQNYLLAAESVVQIANYPHRYPDPSILGVTMILTECLEEVILQKHNGANNLKIPAHFAKISDIPFVLNTANDIHMKENIPLTEAFYELYMEHVLKLDLTTVEHGFEVFLNVRRKFAQFLSQLIITHSKAHWKYLDLADILNDAEDVMINYEDEEFIRFETGTEIYDNPEHLAIFLSDEYHTQVAK